VICVYRGLKNPHSETCDLQVSKPLYLLTGYFRKPSAGLSGLSLFIDREIMEIKALSQPATCLKKIMLILST
jgi:hypothetical protein